MLSSGWFCTWIRKTEIDIDVEQPARMMDKNLGYCCDRTLTGLTFRYHLRRLTRGAWVAASGSVSGLAYKPSESDVSQESRLGILRYHNGKGRYSDR